MTISHRRTTEPSDEDILAANAPPRRETEEARVADRTGWQKRFQSLTLEQYNEGERFDYRGPPDMTEYVGQNVGRGMRPVREPSPTPRFDPNFPYWQRPLHERTTGKSIITYTPPSEGGESRVRRGWNRQEPVQGPVLPASGPVASKKPKKE